MNSVGDTWAPLELGKLLADGPLASPSPSILVRSDGAALLYEDKDHSIFGEPESCKSWVATIACRQQLRAGRHVTVLDFEGDAPTLVERLRALGAENDDLAALLHYVAPEEPITDEGWERLAPALERSTLVVIDGVNEALALHGLDPNSNGDVARFNRLLVRGVKRFGQVATLQVDHVTKDRENRGRNAIGAQHKLAGVDVALSTHVIRPFGRGRTGEVSLKVRKDRAGHIRALQNEDGEVARIVLESQPSGAVDAEIAPANVVGSTTFRPTALMERLSRALEENPGLGKRAIRKLVPGNSSAKDLALDLLIAEGFVYVNPDGRTQAHYSSRPFREAAADGDRAPTVPKDRDHRDPACPSGARDGDHDRAHVPPSLKTGHGARWATPEENERAEYLLGVSAYDDGGEG